MDLDITRKWVLRVILQGQQTVCHKEQPLQHLLEDHHRLPQSTIKTKISRIYWNAMEPPMDPPEHLLNLAKVQDPLKERARHQNLTPGTSSGIGSTAQPAGSSNNTIVCSACGESGHWSKNCPYFNFCDVCRVTTHSTYMCRVLKHGNATARSPVCIYCGKTNHGSAYCRYRPRHNHEEPRNTPDVLRTGTTGKNSAPVARYQTGSAPHNNNKVPFLSFRW